MARRATRPGRRIDACLSSLWRAHRVSFQQGGAEPAGTKKSGIILLRSKPFQLGLTRSSATCYLRYMLMYAPCFDMPTAEQCTAWFIKPTAKGRHPGESPLDGPSRPMWLARQESWSPIQPCIIQWSEKHWPMPCYLCHVIALEHKRGDDLLHS